MYQTMTSRFALLVMGLGATAALGGRSACAATAPVSAGVSAVSITMTDDAGCALDFSSAKAGPVTFTIVNKTATAITEIELLSENRIIGEKENLAPGLPPVSLTLSMGGGTYQVYCPGAKTELQNFTVTGKAAAAPRGGAGELLRQGTVGYGNYVAGVIDAMTTAVGRFKSAIDSGDLAAAKAEYPKARVFYERVESDVDGFVLPGFKATDNAGNLDYLIDMRASNLDPKVGWHGFHAIERDLFQGGAITDGTRQYAAELQKNVEQLNSQAKGLTFRPEDLANGAADLLEEVQNTKITGEEENFSHYDLVDFAANVEGAEQAFAFLEPGMRKIDAELTNHIRGEFTNVRAMLDTYRDPSAPGGYRIYTAELKASDGAKLSKAIQALQQPLSKIAAKVATVSGGAAK